MEFSVEWQHLFSRVVGHGEQKMTEPWVLKVWCVEQNVAMLTFSRSRPQTDGTRMDYWELGVGQECGRSVDIFNTYSVDGGKRPCFGIVYGSKCLQHQPIDTSWARLKEDLLVTVGCSPQFRESHLPVWGGESRRHSNNVFRASLFPFCILVSLWPRTSSMFH